MIETITTFLESNMLWASVGLFVATVVGVARGIFTRHKNTEGEDFIDVEYLMDDNDVFVSPNDV